ncbi:hypothetical protein EV175_000904 [Coemansia sp. RSA 1933]|nr:hypothetical protein EV175_000904 [Coemansia sp. RSA 1933]
MNQKRSVWISLNKAILIGNVGADTKTFETKNGAMRGNFPLATSSRYKDKEGNVLEQTSWHRISLSPVLAERASRIVKKGAVVQVEGSIRYFTFTNKEGAEVNGSEIVASSFQILVFPKRPEGEQVTEEAATEETTEEQ